MPRSNGKQRYPDITGALMLEEERLKKRGMQVHQDEAPKSCGSLARPTIQNPQSLIGARIRKPGTRPLILIALMILAVRVQRDVITGIQRLERLASVMATRLNWGRDLCCKGLRWKKSYLIILVLRRMAKPRGGRWYGIGGLV